MAGISQSILHNRLLRTLAPEDFGLLQPHLSRLKLKRGDVLIKANEPIEHIDFPEVGIVSIVASTEDGRCIEVGLYGREGMSGTAVLLGADRTPHENLCQVPGSTVRMTADDLRFAVRRSPSLHGLFLRYVQAFQIQAAYTALSNGSYSIKERLARWLLMCRDRLDRDEIPLTHEFLGVMLGVRRSGVTLALQVLERAGVIQARRGLITLLNRDKLEAIAGDSYGMPESEYARLVVPPGERKRRPAGGMGRTGAGLDWH